MTDILLTTLNARYSHCAFGLRYLMANLDELRPRALIHELLITQRPLDIAEGIMALRPRIVGLGVAIWNLTPSTHVARLLKLLDPGIILVLGGPEVSHHPEEVEITRYADHVITGEADLAFRDLCRILLSNGEKPPRIIQAEPPDLAALALPYTWYGDDDIDHRVIYVESTRGCPMRCDFCLSAVDSGVRHVPLTRFLSAMQDLLDRGVNRFKFVDRSFNLNSADSVEILRFFRSRYRPGLFLHLECTPDHWTDPLKEAIAAFPSGSLQLEVGVQSLDPEVSRRINRPQHAGEVMRSLDFLRHGTQVHLHTDLVLGLPGEDLDSIAEGFDRLVSLEPHEIQVGILKRLRGAPIDRHTSSWAMIYDPEPPYEVLSTSRLDFPTMQRLRRFSRYWELVANSGRFVHSAPLVWCKGSPFRSFLAFSDWLYQQTGRTCAIAPEKLATYLRRYLVLECALEAERIDEALLSDGSFPGGLRPEQTSQSEPSPAAGTEGPPRPSCALARQRRHNRRSAT